MHISSFNLLCSSSNRYEINIFKLQPPFKITCRWNTKGREQYDLNRETYEDVITLAVKHLGMRIRPDAFAMLVCAQCFGGK